MGKSLAPRVNQAGPYRPTLPRTGDNFNAAFRMGNMILRGRVDGRMYWQSFSGFGSLNESVPMTALTGTLALTQDDTTITGTGSLFFSECHLGQKICAIKGSNSWPLVVRRVVSDTEMIVWRAPDSSDTGVTGWRMPRLNTSNQDRMTCLTGNDMPLDKGSRLGVGSGTVKYNGQSVNTAWTLNRHPAIDLFDTATEIYTPFPLGMTTPTGITAAAVSGGVKGMQGGSYSLVVTPGRKETGGYNNPSERVDVTIATNDKVRITFPAMDTTNGQNAWQVWVTTFAFNFGADLNYLNGPWFYYITIDDGQVSSGGGTYDIEWLDAEVEVNELVSFNNDAPTDAEWVAPLNNIPVWISCQGQGNALNPTQTSPGPFIVPAKPTNIEAAPLDLAFSSSPPETILWALSAQGRIYLPTPNHLQIAQATPDDTIPILIRPYWRDGFAGPDQIVFVNGMLYGFPMAGPSRSVGDGDEIEAERGWAADVYEITQDWSPGHVLVGYDPFNNGIVFFYSGFRRNASTFWTTFWIMYGLSINDWIAAGEISDLTKDQIVSGVATIGDRLQLLVGGRQ